MYVSIRRYEGIDAETAREVVRRGSSGLRQQLSERAGFVAYEVVGGEGSIASISVFDTWVSAEESNVVAAYWIREHLADFALPEPQITAGEVFVEPGSDRVPFAPSPSQLELPEPDVAPSPLAALRRWLRR